MNRDIFIYIYQMASALLIDVGYEQIINLLNINDIYR